MKKFHLSSLFLLCSVTLAVGVTVVPSAVLIPLTAPSGFEMQTKAFRSLEPLATPLSLNVMRDWPSSTDTSAWLLGTAALIGLGTVTTRRETRKLFVSTVNRRYPLG